MIIITNKRKKGKVLHDDVMDKSDFDNFSSIINSIYYTPNVQKTRIDAAEKIVSSDAFLNYYDRYMKYYNRLIHSYNFNQRSALAENNQTFKLIEMLGSSILYTADAREFNMKNKNKSYTKEILDIRINREEKIDNYAFCNDSGEPMSTDDKIDLFYNTNMQDPRNYYKPKTQVIKAEDFEDKDFDTVISVINPSSGAIESTYTSNMLKDYENFREHIKIIISKNLLNPRKIKTLALQRSTIKKDQIDLKEIIKRPIRIKHGG